jgi:hypothetical protein
MKTEKNTHRSNSRTLPKETPKAEETSLESIHALMACLQRWEEQPDKPIEQKEVSARVNDIVVLFGQNDDASSDEKNLTNPLQHHHAPAAWRGSALLTIVWGRLQVWVCLGRFIFPLDCLGRLLASG